MQGPGQLSAAIQLWNDITLTFIFTAKQRHPFAAITQDAGQCVGPNDAQALIANNCKPFQAAQNQGHQAGHVSTLICSDITT